MSMCSSAEPNENSMAERLNRTLKEEFNLGNGFVSEEVALKMIPQVIDIPTIITALMPHLISKRPRNVIILGELKN